VTSNLQQFKKKALAKPGVSAAYDELAEEFAFLDEVLKARSKTGLTQAEVAERMGTTQSAVARLESANAKHSPSLATLQRYAQALGHRVEVRLVKA
jgi:predicted transcriptional regulator